ncbi:uncharacterized protein [Littorina saxatilis]|uniref:uncharacterized protein isoform X3 n=1 Tax=Littorina saxatilis TaxID=31220 RepID=UPI0038B5C9E1
MFVSTRPLSPCITVVVLPLLCLQLNGNHGANKSVALTEPPALLVNGETPISTPQQTRRPLIAESTRSPGVDNSKTAENNNNHTQTDGAPGLASGESTRLSRLLLAKSAAHALMANKPGQPEVTVTTDMPDTDNLSVPWDAPLMSARNNTLSPEIDGSGYISPCSIYSIEADLMAEKDELLDEEDKHELARRLEQEVTGSILALWRERLNQPMIGSDIEIEYDSDDDTSFGMRTPTSTSPRSPPSPSRILVPPPPAFAGGERGGPSAFAYVNRAERRSRTGSIQSDSSEDMANASLETARMKLRKTRFDYNKDSLRRPTEVTPRQMDFRHVLKKGGKPGGD